MLEQINILINFRRPRRILFIARAVNNFNTRMIEVRVDLLAQFS